MRGKEALSAARARNESLSLRLTQLGAQCETEGDEMSTPRYCASCWEPVATCVCDADQTDVFTPPPPPTGPQAETYTEQDGRPAAFTAFLASPEGGLFWVAVQAAALTAFQTGEQRFSPRDFLSSYRAQHGVRVNNVFSPWFADMLVERHPQLLAIIERRKRKKAGP